MGFLSRAVSERKSMDTLDLFREIYGGKTSKAGPRITLESAFKQATACACLKVLSQGCAQVPFKLFREFQDAGLTKIEPARDLPLYDLLTTRPNGWQTSFEFRETLVLHAALGNAYVWKNLVTGRRIGELILLDPSRMLVEHPDEYSPPVYKYTSKNGVVLNFAADLIWHVRGPSWNGYAGMELLHLAREALGLAIATEDTHAKLHANGVRTSGTYSVEGTLSLQQYKDLKAWLISEMTGADNAGAPMVLDRNAKWLAAAMTGLDAEHLDTRNFQGAEICRFFGVLPSKVGFTDKAATYASAEQFAIQHVVDTMGPWYARIEQSADVNLLTEKERASGLYFKFVAAGLLRGASKDRAEYFAKALGSGGSPGWMTPDEIRGLEELNPMGGEAAKLPVASNMPEAAPPDPADEAKAVKLERQQDDLHEAKLLELRRAPVSPVVNVAAPVVTVNPPSIKAGDVHVTLPAVAAPIVNIKNEIPEQPAPIVNVTPGEVKVNVAAPVVNFKADAPVMPDTMNVHIKSQSPRDTTSTITRDAENNIVGSKASERDK